ncbi:MAG: hypothetical protein COT74_09155 [Bdellovibrionales bacterium CG10_big_fil_rev_8_21_14_0_10_45_34]|nr:MAG: hypothetical protein COT74_09155 [Bdellovibrionales bacterium CG10_big_fil_rev_8_21_14_0_10_45_34]
MASSWRTRALYSVTTVLGFIVLGYSACSPYQAARTTDLAGSSDTANSEAVIPSDGEGSQENRLPYDEISFRSNQDVLLLSAGATPSCEPFSTWGWRWSVDDMANKRTDSCLIEQANILFDQIYRDYSNQSQNLQCEPENSLYLDSRAEMLNLWDQVSSRFERAESYTSQLYYFNMRLSAFDALHAGRQTTCKDITVEPVQITAQAAWRNSRLPGRAFVELRGIDLNRVTLVKRSFDDATISEQSSDRLLIEIPNMVAGFMVTTIDLFSQSNKVGSVLLSIPSEWSTNRITRVEKVGQDRTGFLLRAWGHIYATVVKIESNCGPVQIIESKATVDFRMKEVSQSVCDFTFTFLRGEKTVLSNIATGVAETHAKPAPYLSHFYTDRVIVSENRSYVVIKGSNFSEKGDNNIVSDCSLIEKVYDGVDGAGQAGIRQINLRIESPTEDRNCQIQVKRPDGLISNIVAAKFLAKPRCSIELSQNGLVANKVGLSVSTLLKFTRRGSANGPLFWRATEPNGFVRDFFEQGELAASNSVYDINYTGITPGVWWVDSEVRTDTGSVSCGRFSVTVIGN